MRSLIALVLNIIWLVTAGGWALFLGGYLLAGGVLACIFIVTIRSASPPSASPGS